MLIYCLAALAVAFADQFSKAMVLHNLQGAPSFVLIPGVLQFTFTTNDGAAMHLFAGQRWLFMTLSVLIIVVVTAFVIKEKPKSKLVLLSLGAVAGGGVGNMIDRIFRHDVVDFIDVSPIHVKLFGLDLNFPYIFNVADAFVCVGCAVLIVCVIVGEIREQRAKKESGGERD